jgi:hypothetical protein
MLANMPGPGGATIPVTTGAVVDPDKSEGVALSSALCDEVGTWAWQVE